MAQKLLTFKPMLSGKCEDVESLRFPVLVSPKLDGIRCIIRDGVAVSRKLLPLPNSFVQRELSGIPEGFDGELIVGEPFGEGVYKRTVSGVMSEDGEPDFRFYVFDNHTHPGVFADRLASLGGANPRLSPVPHIEICDTAALTLLEDQMVAAGYEGVMIRDPNGRYKYGRSTVKEGGLLKLKRWYDDTARVVGVVEQMRNDNPLEEDALGHAKRSTSKKNKVGKGVMGALECVSICGKYEFEIGTGFTDAERAEDWNVGDLIDYKYQSRTEDMSVRFGVFLRRRHPDDVTS